MNDPTKLHPTIQEYLGAIEAVTTKAKFEIERIQHLCPHKIVYEIPWRALEMLGGCLNARRICAHCRLEEEGSHWSGGSTWSQKDHGVSNLGNEEDRLVVPLEDRDEFYRKRINL